MVYARVLRADLQAAAKASRQSASAPSQAPTAHPSTEEETSELRLGAAQPHANVTTASAALTVATSSPIEIFPPAHPVSCGDARRAERAYAAGSGGGREQRAGGRADHGKQQQQARSHVRAAGVGEGGWAGPGGREAEAQCASPGQPPTPAAAGRRGCGVLFTAKPQASRSQRGTGPGGETQQETETA